MKSSTKLTQGDLYYRLCNDPAFVDSLSRMAQQLENSEKLYKTGRGSLSDIRENMMRVLRECDYNAALLVPYFFPQYPTDQPLNLLTRPFMLEMLKLQFGGFTVFRAGRQVGKSTGFGVRQRTYAGLLPKYRSLYICPHSEQKATYAHRLEEIHRAYCYSDHSPKRKKNLYRKEFTNDAVIEMINVLTTADPSRGKTTDELLWDEVQNMDPNLEPEVQQTQKASKMPVTIYAGTSLTLDTMLEAKWEASSKGTWFIKSPNGKDWINTGDKDTVLKMIQPAGLTCPFSGQLVDPRNGGYVHEDRQMQAAGQVGLHIPQIIIPEYTIDALKWDEIYQSFLDYGEAKFLQEVIGIPVEEADRELSRQELQACCVLEHNTLEHAIKLVKSGRYKFTVSGCDWGGSDYNPAMKTKQSYTVHNVLGCRADGKFENLHFKRYSGMHYREIIDDIAVTHAKLNCFGIASDFGVGAAYNMLLREHPAINPLRHVIFGYTSQRAIVARPSGSMLFNHLSLNRTETMSLLIQELKQNNPRLLFRKWGVEEKYLDDFLNVYRVIQESTATGARSFTYRRHGSKPDDAFHATNFAFTLGRLIMGEPLINDPALVSEIRKNFRGFTTSRRGAAVVSG